MTTSKTILIINKNVKSVDIVKEAVKSVLLMRVFCLHLCFKQ